MRSKEITSRYSMFFSEWWSQQWINVQVSQVSQVSHDQGITGKIIPSSFYAVSVYKVSQELLARLYINQWLHLCNIVCQAWEVWICSYKMSYWCCELLVSKVSGIFRRHMPWSFAFRSSGSVKSLAPANTMTSGWRQPRFEAVSNHGNHCSWFTSCLHFLGQNAMVCWSNLHL